MMGLADGGCDLGSRASLAPYVPPLRPTAFRRNQQPKTQGQRNEIKAEVTRGLLSGWIGWLGMDGDGDVLGDGYWELEGSAAEKQ